MTDFRSRDQPRKPKKFLPHIFVQGFTSTKPFVASLLVIPVEITIVLPIKNDPIHKCELSTIS